MNGKDAIKVLLNAPKEMDISEEEDKWCPAILENMEGLDKADDMKSVLDGLTLPQLDAMMRAVYFGLESEKNCQNLLKWHAAVLEKSGIGSIVRYLCDRPLVKTSSGDKDEEVAA